jgi:cytochrome c-type biogenesis protein CcmH/NrfF
VIDVSAYPFVLWSFPFWMVVMTAVWARTPRRRADARRVLDILMRRPHPGQA